MSDIKAKQTDGKPVSVDGIVSRTVDFEDFKRAVLLLQRAYCAIEPKQNWGDGRIVDYKPFISEANKFVNEIRHKYKF